MTHKEETIGYAEKLAIAAEEFRAAIDEETTAKQVYDDAKLNAKLAGKVYYDARNILDKLVGA